MVTSIFEDAKFGDKFRLEGMHNDFMVYLFKYRETYGSSVHVLTYSDYHRYGYNDSGYPKQKIPYICELYKGMGMAKFVEKLNIASRYKHEKGKDMLECASYGDMFVGENGTKFVFIRKCIRTEDYTDRDRYILYKENYTQRVIYFGDGTNPGLEERIVKHITNDTIWDKIKRLWKN